MTSPKTNEHDQTDAVPPIVDQGTWKASLDELREREKAATRELDAIAAARRRLPMVELPDGGFQLNVFLRVGGTAYRTYNTQGRGVEQVSHTFSLIDLLPYGRQEEWQDVPTGWPQSPTCSRWASSEDHAVYADVPG